MAVKTLEMVRAIRTQQFEETEAMTPAERLAYYRARARECRRRMAVSSSPSGARPCPPT